MCLAIFLKPLRKPYVSVVIPSKLFLENSLFTCYFGRDIIAKIFNLFCENEINQFCCSIRLIFSKIHKNNLPCRTVHVLGVLRARFSLFAANCHFFVRKSDDNSSKFSKVSPPQFKINSCFLYT